MDTNLLLPEQTQAFAKQQTWVNKANLNFSLTTMNLSYKIWASDAKANLHFSLTTDELFCAFLCKCIAPSCSLTMQAYCTELLSNNVYTGNRFRCYEAEIEESEKGSSEVCD